MARFSATYVAEGRNIQSFLWQVVLSDRRAVISGSARNASALHSRAVTPGGERASDQAAKGLLSRPAYGASQSP